jgi:uncharacterized damage-inducible protein DinB
MIQMLLKEMDNEAKTTRKMLERIPADKFSWKPHEKSMTVQQLATHIAELPAWVSMVLTTSELDFADNPYEQKNITTTADLLKLSEESLTDGRAHLSTATEKDLEPNWTLRNGEQIYNVSSKAEMVRITYCQIVHHRAQLGVYLRLLNIPIPGSYGPSADEMTF